jgi:hypothetical protein
MKTITWLLLISLSTLAFSAPPQEFDPEVDYLKSNAEGILGSKEYEWKSHTSCTKRVKGSDPAYPNLLGIDYYVCPDKTISHIQPASRGYSGWEGYCGQTALSNITSMMCNRHMSPKGNDFYGTDLTPGQSPITLKKSFRKVFSEKPKLNTCPKVTWNLRSHWTKSSFLKSVRGDLFGSKNKIKRYRNQNTYVNVTPTPVLLNSGGASYHWVTVVDIKENKLDHFGCDVVLNTWGDQKTITCDRFIYYADHSGISEYVHLGFD